MTNGAVQRPSTPRGRRRCRARRPRSRLGGAVGAERVRVERAAGGCRGVATGLVDHAAHRVDGAAADPAAQADTSTSVVSVSSPAPSARGLLGGSSTPRSDGTESKPQACTMRAPVAGAASCAVSMLSPHEQHLAGQVGVVRAGGGAGLHQRQPVPGVRPDGADHDPGRVGQGRAARRGVGDEQRPVVPRAPPARRGPTARAAAARRADRLEPFRERPARPIRTAAGAARARCSAVSRPDEAGRAEHDARRGRGIPAG